MYMYINYFYIYIHVIAAKLRKHEDRYRYIHKFSCTLFHLGMFPGMLPTTLIARPPPIMYVYIDR